MAPSALEKTDFVAMRNNEKIYAQVGDETDSLPPAVPQTVSPVTSTDALTDRRRRRHHVDSWAMHIIQINTRIA